MVASAWTQGSVSSVGLKAWPLGFSSVSRVGLNGQDVPKTWSNRGRHEMMRLRPGLISPYAGWVDIIQGLGCIGWWGSWLEFLFDL